MIKYFILKVLGLFDFYHQLKIFKFLAKKKLTDFNIFLDIGAHKGETLQFFLKNFEVNQIFSFEASKPNYEILKKNFSLIENKFLKTKVYLENFALGSENKKAKFKSNNSQLKYSKSKRY